MGRKTCRTCNLEKELLEFSKDKYKSDGICTRCKTCTSAYKKSHKQKNPSLYKKYKRTSHLKTAYSITQNEFLSMLATQAGKCAICGSNESKSTRKKELCIDHNHETGKLRGILCDSCNRALGLFQDNSDLLRSALKYLDIYEKNR